MDMQLLVVVESAPIRKSTRVIEQHPGRDFLVARIAIQVAIVAIFGQRLRQVLVNGLVESKYALLDELQNQISKGDLGEGRRTHHRIRC